jgi:hypothetical protein
LLLLEVAVDQLNREHPLPDTGSLDEDLRAWAQKIAAALRSKRGFAFFKVIVANASRGGARNSARVRAMEPRLKQIEAIGGDTTGTQSLDQKSVGASTISRTLSDPLARLDRIAKHRPVFCGTYLMPGIF